MSNFLVCFFGRIEFTKKSFWNEITFINTNILCSELQHESDRSPLKSDTRQDYSPLSLLHIFAGFYCACGHYSVSNFRWKICIKCRISPLSSKMPISWRQFLRIWFKHVSESKTVEYHFKKVRNHSHLWLFITPARSHFISGLKSRVLKLTIFCEKIMVKGGLEFYFKVYRPPSELLLPSAKSWNGQIGLAA